MTNLLNCVISHNYNMNTIIHNLSCHIALNKKTRFFSGRFLFIYLIQKFICQISINVDQPFLFFFFFLITCVFKYII